MAHASGKDAVHEDRRKSVELGRPGDEEGDRRLGGRERHAHSCSASRHFLGGDSEVVGDGGDVDVVSSCVVAICVGY